MLLSNFLSTGENGAFTLHAVARSVSGESSLSPEPVPSACPPGQAPATYSVHPGDGPGTLQRPARAIFARQELVRVDIAVAVVLGLDLVRHAAVGAVVENLAAGAE
jgi:hypothetical protein